MIQQRRDYKRKNYFIKKEFQFKFIIKFCSILLCGIVLSTVLVFLFSQETLTSSFDNSRLVIRNTGDAIMQTLLITNLITLGVITLSAIGVTLFVSHRIAGPMFRFEQDIKKIASGDLLVRIHLRQTDQFAEMAKAFNEMASSLHGKLSKMDQDLDKLLISDRGSKTAEEYKNNILELKEILHKNFSL
ncbi:MAG: HAMP domain-containing protein [Desulfobacula sp.]|nr:HAMP domain-containing protein [Desulfobacula sp.]